jgi:lipopolysaccharide export system protein LptA
MSARFHEVSRRAVRFGALLGLCVTALVAERARGAEAPGFELQKTTVKADRLEMRNDGVESHYEFTGHIRITGTNLEITCDRLEIFATSKPGEKSEGRVPATGNIRRMLATGNVAISQEGQKATCGTAEVLPGEEQIILTDNPVVTDVAKDVTVKGTRMFARRDRSIEIENPEIVGPALPNFGPPVATPGESTAPTAPPTPPPATP